MSNLQTNPEEKPLRELMKALDEPVGDPPSLSQLQKEAAQFGHRRADEAGSRDNLIYHLGYALDAIGGLKVSSRALAGVLSSLPAIKTIADKAISYNEHSGKNPLDFLEAVKNYLKNVPSFAAWAEAEGRWLEWERLRELRLAETDDFRQSEQFEQSGWRKRKPTPFQLYLIAKIEEASGKQAPDIRTRFDAFTFIAEAGGNPRFLHAPQRLPMPRFS